jgi:hypothetical protein
VKGQINQNRSGDRPGTRLGLTPDRIIDLLAMHSNIARRINADANLVASDLNYGDPNVVTDDYRFVALT